jgi:hypothetical protein
VEGRDPRGAIQATPSVQERKLSLEPSTLIRQGQTVLSPLGFKGVFMASVENACACGSTAFKLAVHAVRHGQVNLEEVLRRH